jgi:hypothetical protein
MKYILIFCIVATTLLLVTHRMDQRYAEGVAEGRRTALHTSPVSEELEMVCAGLWVGDQAKKAQAKENAR